MPHADELVLDILQNPLSECAWIDYKRKPYSDEKKSDFIKDVIAMLNSTECIGEDKFIIFGVDDKKELIGLNGVDFADDNEWQDLADKILPRPELLSGTVDFESKQYGYIYISKINTEGVYEVYTTYGKGKYKVHAGQAFTRKGSSNKVLNEVGRNVLRKHLSEFSKQQVPIQFEEQDIETIKLLALIGRLDSSARGDREIVSSITEKEYAKLHNEIESLAIKYDQLFYLRNDVIYCRKHKEILMGISKHFLDKDINAFFNEVTKAFTEINPIYNISPEQWTLTNRMKYQNERVYSQGLIEGVSQTIALLNNNIEKFRNLSPNKIYELTTKFMQNFWKAADWRILATVETVFTNFAEARPTVFLENVGHLLNVKDSSLRKYIDKTSEGLFKIDYLEVSLCRLAAYERYFTQAMKSLFDLCILNEDGIYFLTGILLPGRQLTMADIGMKCGILRELADKNEDLIWKALMIILNREWKLFTTILPPEYMNPPEIGQEVPFKEFMKEEREYVSLTCDLIENSASPEKVEDLLHSMTKVEKDSRVLLWETVKNETTKLKQPDKEKIWNVLKDIISYHKRYPEFSGNLAPEIIDEMEMFCKEILPDSSKVEQVRLFKKNQRSLYEDRDNYAEEEKLLRERQLSVLEQIHKSEGLHGIFSFIEKIEHKFLAGFYLAEVLPRQDIRSIIKERENPVNDELVRGLLKNINSGILMELTCSLSDYEQAKILAKSDIDDLVLDRVHCFDAHAKKEYWEEVQVFPINLDEGSELGEVISSLIQVGRIKDSIELMGYILMVKKDLPVDPSLVVQCMLENNETNGEIVDDIANIIEWLQTKSSCTEELLDIEWKYLAIINSYSFQPKCTNQKILHNPEFFVDIVRKQYEFDNLAWKEERRKSAILLEGLRRCPCTNSDGEVNGLELEQWVSKVEQLTQNQSDLLICVKRVFGELAFYAPAADDGFFMNHKIASYLQKEDNSDIRLGYFSGAVRSSCYCSTDGTGQWERDKAESFKEKARKAIKFGYSLFSDTLFEIAEYYFKDAERIVNEARNGFLTVE